MPSRLSAGSRASQRYNASGEATPQATLPAEYVSNPPAASPLSGHLSAPVDHASFVPGQPNAVVLRAPRMVGMRYLNAAGHIRMPIKQLGADGIPRPWISAVQPNLHGPIHDAGFNDALFQAGIVNGGIGWPGSRPMALSFKVPAGPVPAATTNQPPVQNPVSIAVNRLRRSTGRPAER